MKKSGINKSVLKRLLRYAKPHAGFLLLALVSAIINVSLTLYGPILVGRAIDYVIGPDQVDFAAMVPVLITLAGTIVVSAAFQWLMTYCTNRVSYKTVRDLRIQTYEKINTLPLKYIDGHAHGDLISRIVNDVDQVSDGLLQGITQLFTGVVTIVGTLLFMLTISPVITVVVVLVTPAFTVRSGLYRPADPPAVCRAAGDPRRAFRLCGGDDRRTEDRQDLPL